METMEALRAQFPKEDEPPRPSPPRMALPGPTWPLGSHPDNARKFVATHTKSAGGGSDNSAYDRIMKQFMKMDDHEIGIRFDLVSKHPMLDSYIKNVRGAEISFGELSKCEEIVGFHMWLEEQSAPAPTAPALPQPVRETTAVLDPEMDKKLQEMGSIRPEKKQDVEAPSSAEQQPKVAPVQSQPTAAAVPAQVPQPKVAISC